jgi:hypothetical protein
MSNNEDYFTAKPELDELAKVFGTSGDHLRAILRGFSNNQHAFNALHYLDTAMLWAERAFEHEAAARDEQERNERINELIAQIRFTVLQDESEDVVSNVLRGLHTGGSQVEKAD